MAGSSSKSVSSAGSPVDTDFHNLTPGKLDLKNDPHFKNGYFFSTILSHLPTNVDVDWDDIAKKAGYPNANTAKARFGQIKEEYSYPDGKTLYPTPAPKAPAKPRAKKEKAIGSGTNTGASKVTKTTTKKKVKVPASETLFGLGDDSSGANTDESDDEAEPEISYQPTAARDEFQFFDL